MSLRDLQINVMITICSYFITTCKDILQGHPLTKSIYDYAKSVHEVLTLSITTKHETTIEKLTRLASQLDKRHDALNRGVYGVLSAFSEFATDPKKKEDILTVRDTLFPMGLSVNSLSYSAQAGEAKRLEEQLKDPQLQRTLKAMFFGDGQQQISVYQALTELTQIGEKLGDTLASMSKHKAELKTNTSTTPQVKTEGEARLMFFQLVRMLQETSKVTLEHQSDKATILWQKLNEELSRAASSKARSEKESEDIKTAPPTPTEDPITNTVPQPSNTTQSNS